MDYQNLTAFAPNEYWGPSGKLALALYLLAYAHKEAGDRAAGATAMGPQRVKVFERLAQVDPDKYGPALSQAQADAAAFGI